MQDYSNVKVGDKVWFTDTANGKGRIDEGTVTKVGPELITIDANSMYRGTVFRKDTGRENDQYGHNLLIPDLDTYNERKLVVAAFRTLYNRLGALEEGVTYDDLIKAAALLGYPDLFKDSQN